MLNISFVRASLNESRRSPAAKWNATKLDVVAGDMGKPEEVKKKVAPVPPLAEGGTGPRNAGEGETADLRHDAA